jgi:hypothetical protein
VAFIQDDQGQAIDDEELENIVEEKTERGTLPPSAVPSVCGFTPDADIEAMNTPSSACEVEFRWIGGDGDGSDSDPCSSETYLCGINKPHWQARVTCVMAATSCGGPASSANPTDPEIESQAPVPTPDGPDVDVPESRDPAPPRTGVAPADGATGNGWFTNSDPPTSADSTMEYVRWHFVVAPTVSACNGLAEPGFRMSSQVASIPYLAHDLDVYTPAAHSSINDNTNGFTNVRDWTQAVARELFGRSDDRVPDTGEIGGPTTLPVEETRSNVAKDWIAEPNTVHDRSKEHVHVERDNPCTQLQGTTETPETQDPWVDVTDSRVIKTGAGTDPYQNEREDQSAGNRPGPGWYTTRGMTGVFADPNDDGEYEQATSQSVFSDIHEEGAYPMFWDLRLDEENEIDTEAGCRMGEDHLPEMMAEAGYGERTGLIQIVLLREGADWYFRDDGLQLEHENIVGLDGDPGSPAPNAYLFMSQGLWELYEDQDHGVRSAVAEMLKQLPVANYDLWPSTEMLEPSEEGRSDFYPQCQEGTGGFTSRWDFTHHCVEEEPISCEDDTVVTAYLYEDADGDGVIGGSGIPAFQPTGSDPYEGFDGSDAYDLWLDVDPLDDDPDRNTRDGSPPTGEE